MPSAAHELGGLEGSDLGAGDEPIGPDARADQEAAEPLRLTTTLERQGPEVIVPVPRRGVAGMGVPHEVDGLETAFGGGSG